MKFRDIPTYTTGSYEVDVSLEFLKDHLDRISEVYGLELNPDFQRGEVWEEQSQIKFVEHLLKDGKSSRVIYFNSPVWTGSKSSAECDLEDTVLCVDGLQRITSLLKFLNNELKAFGFYYKEFEDRIPFYVGIKLNINSLQTRKEVLNWYLDMNEGIMVHSDSELERVRNLLKDIK